MLSSPGPGTSRGPPQHRRDARAAGRLQGDDPATGRVLATGRSASCVPAATSSSFTTCTMRRPPRSAVDADGFVHTGDLGTPWIARLPHDHRAPQGAHHPRWREHCPRRTIESVLAECDSVVESAVVGLPDERFGEIVTVVLRCGLTSAPISKRSGRACPRAGSPATRCRPGGIVADQFPITPTGKVRGSSCARRFCRAGSPNCEPTIGARRDALRAQFPAWGHDPGRMAGPLCGTLRRTSLRPHRRR